MSVALDQLPERPRQAWERLRDELRSILADDLVAVWAYGGSVAAGMGGVTRHRGDLDTYVIVRRQIGERTASGIDAAQAAIGAELGAEWDTWVVLENDARRPEAPAHAYRHDRRDTSWAINRAHWLAGRYAHLHGAHPTEVVPAPTWPEVTADLDRELEHLEAHVANDDTDAFEATYAVLNGSRILRALATKDVAISKREAGDWALERLPDRWHPTLRAAIRAYEERPGSEDVALLAAEMGPFVAMVRAGLAPLEERDADFAPRWSGS